MADTKLTMLIDLGTKMFNSNLEKLKSKWDQTVDKMKVKYNSLIEKLPAGMGKAVDKLKTPITTAFAGMAVAAGTMLTGAVKQADTWHTQMAEINVTAELSRNQKCYSFR